MVAHDFARARGGTFLLRFEDIDRTRSRTHWEEAVLADLTWLGIRPDETPMRQSEHLQRHRAALARLWSRGLLFPCTCTRADIRAALSAPQEGAPALGPDGPVYPGTCRGVPRGGDMPEGTLRLDMGAALALLTDDLDFVELSDGRRVTLDRASLVAGVGDVVLARRDIGTSYHLAVVVDDAAQGITHVTRGHDLFEATAIHVVLAHLLELPVPLYLHHRLVRDACGRRLAKRHDARAIAAYRKAGASPADLRRIVGLSRDEYGS